MPKKIKIISERIRTEFKELEPEVEEKEIEEENEFEESEDSLENKELSPDDFVAPALEFSKQEQTLEQALENVPSAQTEKDEDTPVQYERAKVYNMPNYSPTYEPKQNPEEESKIPVKLAEQFERSEGRVVSQVQFQNQLESEMRLQERQAQEEAQYNDIKTTAEGRRIPFSRERKKEERKVF